MRSVIVAIVLVSLLSVAVTIVVADRVFDGTVTKDPYEKGLLWDHVQKEKEDSGLSVSLNNDGFATGMNALSLDILDKTGGPLRKAAVSVTVSRPSTTAYDKTYTCANKADGSWRSEVDLPLYGYWDLEIRIIRGGSDILFEKQVYAKK